MRVTDAIVKRAQVTLLSAQPLTPGKFVIVLVGGEEEVAQSLGAGLELGGDTVIDRLYLPKPDPQLALAMGGQLAAGAIDALGVVETFSVAAAILSADRAVKAAETRLVQMRLARGLGGKAYYVLTGELHQVEAAVEAGRSIIHDGMLLTTEIIPRPHADLVRVVLG
jgi:microcompartment protein CcmL/EutN